MGYDDMWDAVEKALEGLKVEYKKSWADERNRLQHREAYGKFIRSLAKRERRLSFSRKKIALTGSIVKRSLKIL